MLDMAGHPWSSLSSRVYLIRWVLGSVEVSLSKNKVQSIGERYQGQLLHSMLTHKHVTLILCFSVCVHMLLYLAVCGCPLREEEGNSSLDLEGEASSSSNTINELIAQWLLTNSCNRTEWGWSCQQLQPPLDLVWPVVVAVAYVSSYGLPHSRGLCQTYRAHQCHVCRLCAFCCSLF